MGSPDPSFSLYVHVPFCVDKCLYCDFYSVPQRSVEAGVQEQVIEQTIEQAEFFRDALGWLQQPQTIFMGGGTPSVLSRGSRARLLSAFSEGAREEWTVEANPESMDEEFLRACAEGQVTRISAGVQSTSDRHLRFLRRACTRRDIERALSALTSSWKGDLNLDFIAGIPGQVPEEVRADLAILDRLAVSHVSLYSLTYEEGTPLSRLAEEGEILRNAEEQDEELWFAGCDELSRRGFGQYEISNFSLPGRECRHNLRYWRIEPYLGAGPGAVSTVPGPPLARALALPGASAPNTVLRLAVPKDIPRFLRGREALWGIQAEIVAPEDFLLETLMMGLRLREGLAAAHLERRFGAPLEELIPGLWQRWMGRGLAEKPGAFMRLTESGRLVLDGLLTEASRAREQTPGAPLRVTWP